MSQIDEFLSSKKYAVVGISSQKGKSGNYIYLELKKKQLNVIPVSLHLNEFDGDKCYPSVKELPSDLDAIIIVTKPEATLEIVKDALDRGIMQIFLQLGAQNQDAIELAKKREANIISHKCILMYVKPNGIHKFHRNLVRIFGKLDV